VQLQEVRGCFNKDKRERIDLNGLDICDTKRDRMIVKGTMRT